MLLEPTAAVLSKRRRWAFCFRLGCQQRAALPRHQPRSASSSLPGEGAAARRGLAHCWPQLLVPFSWSLSRGPLLSPVLGKGEAGEWEEETAALRLSS